MSTKRVLLVEDARDMQIIVKSALSNVCELQCVSTIADAQSALKTNDFALVLLDVELPDGDGFDFCKQLRAQAPYTDLPIIFLTGQTEVESRVLGFQLGADDYVTKPLEPNEFTARVDARLKRSTRANTSFSKNGFRVDLSVHKVFEVAGDGAERALSLTPIEFKLLTLFLQNTERIYSREELLAMFWADTVHVSRHTVDTHISSLRKKMGDSGALLRSVFKKGYCCSASPDGHKHTA